MNIRLKLLLIFSFPVFIFGVFLLLNYSVVHRQMYVQKVKQNQAVFPQDPKKLDTELLLIVEKKDPRTALTVLAQDSEKSDSIAASCHVLAHNIGHAAYKKYHDFGAAMEYQNEFCNSGYLHGVIESYFSSSQSLTSAMATVCQQYPLGSYISWECFHGVGHGIMFYNGNNVPMALLSCSTYINPFSRSSCVNGVFMENFNTDQKLHPSKYLNPSNPFYPCTIEPEMYKSDCYLYAPVYYLHLHTGAFTSALRWCLSAEPRHQNECVEGVGSETMKENINNPKFVEHICESGDIEQKSLCIFGMVELYINNFGSLAPARSLCGILNQENKQPCEEIVNENASRFNT